MYGCLKKRKSGRLSVIVGTAVLLIVAFFLYMHLVVMPILRSVTEEEVRGMTVKAVTESVLEVLEDTPSYVDIVDITYDSENNISGININSAIVATIAQKLALTVQTRLGELGIKGVRVPVGSLTGIMFFAGKGPTVEVRAIPVGSIAPRLCSEFTEAGINQTNHRIYLKIDTSINVVLPGANDLVNTITEVPVLESIIVGKIPSTYLNSTSTQDMMDLIP